MSIENFIQQYELEKYNIHKVGKLSSKILSKVFKLYKYIDIRIYWYDDKDNPNECNWIDIEGIGYGWLWLNYRKYYNKQRNIIRKFSIDWCKNQELYSYTQNNITNYICWVNDCDCVVHIRLSKNKLYYYLQDY